VLLRGYKWGYRRGHNRGFTGVLLYPNQWCGECVARRKGLSEQDRFISQKRGVYYYTRRVPAACLERDTRGAVLKISLKTRHIGEARAKRDVLEAADDALWGALLSDGDADRAQRQYQAAVRRAEAMGFTYQPADVVSQLPLDQLLGRIEAIPDGVPSEVEASVLGGVAQPPVTISRVLKLYLEEIATGELVGKSEQQRRKWENIAKRSVERFIRVVGDVDIGTIEREQALKFWRYWQARIAPKEGPRSHTPSSGNRELGKMRTIYGAYYAHLGQLDRPNPFAGLAFAEKARQKKVRPPFPAEFIRTKLLAPGALERLNAEARAIVLAIVETGARPSEACNLLRENIRLDHEVPHLEFSEREDPDNPRELKSASSIRVVPLVGVALEVFKRFPDGFPRYREKEEGLSQLVNKYLRANDLVPSPKHTLYGLRHSMEDRMKEAGLTDDLRRILLGHRIDREEYGTGGGLAWRRDELLKVALPFSPDVLAGLPDVRL
jgi:integrase